MPEIAKYRHRGDDWLGVLAADMITPIFGPISAGGADPFIAFIESDLTNNASYEAIGDAIPVSEVTLLAPIAAPSKNVFCVGLNYHAHASEFTASGYDQPREDNGAAAPSHPIVFTKAATSLVGAFDDVIVPWNLTQEVDYEAEIGLVIGKPGRAISKENAYDHVWGYTIINDVTARDLQKRHKQWFLGKSIDTFCPIGPGVTTADEVDPDALILECWVNGELRQKASSRDLIFNIPSLIATISASVTLQTGDIIATGTPKGVGIGYTPPRFLSSGDIVRVAINGIGHIENRIV
ncbi:MAG: fumarylacetoacetate hydrolase family protein [Pseudomonadota bacterium]